MYVCITSPFSPPSKRRCSRGTRPVAAPAPRMVPADLGQRSIPPGLPWGRLTNMEYTYIHICAYINIPMCLCIYIYMYDSVCIYDCRCI